MNLLSENMNSTHYISMPDGTKIAMDIWLPEVSEAQQLVPVILELTRYWRAIENQKIKDSILFFNQHGYGYASADVRGTGASTGHRQAEIGVEEVKDFSIIINWLANQPWCNGAVITQGSSYVGNTAEIAMLDAPQSLKAAIPQFTDFDLYALLLFPGGLPNIGFLNPWSDGVRALDVNCPLESIPVFSELAGAHIKPVDDDQDKVTLQQAITEHRDNVPVAAQLANIIYRDDFEAERLSPRENAPHHWVSPYQLRNNLRWREIPSLHWGSFVDAGTAAGLISRFMCSSSPMCAVIGYWSHGLSHDANPFKSKGYLVKPDLNEVLLAKESFLRPLKQQHTINDDLLSERVLHYFTAGEDRWKKTSSWPPLGTRMQHWYLSENASLSTSSPQVPAGSDRYQVRFDVGSGSFGRWYQMDAVYYENRAQADEALLTYTSAPLEKTIEITGHPIVHLQMSSSTSDGAVIVYLEAVAPDGKVVMLTEGNLRLLHRKVSSKTPPYPIFGPYHTFRKEDAELMEPGDVSSVDFVMLPLSVTVDKGYSLRITIAGHDKDYFKRIPESEFQVYKIYRNKQWASSVEIPILENKLVP